MSEREGMKRGKPILVAIRSTFLGHALIGSTFAWSDFPYYVVGCAAAALYAYAVRWRTPGGSAVGGE